MLVLLLLLLQLHLLLLCLTLLLQSLLLFHLLLALHVQPSLQQRRERPLIRQRRLAGTRLRERSLSAKPERRRQKGQDQRHQQNRRLPAESPATIESSAARAGLKP
ncbi:MAG TPA: hypothetical protein VGS41_12235 [Chthonomonadales bacterium]|nr:hypothetical protein [Chthonomonadales bacterium]